MLNLTLPFPPAELFPNRKNGKHWTSTNSAKVAAKNDAFYLTKQAAREWVEPEGNIPLSILFIMPTAHHRDADNMLAAFKAQQDGVALALGVDDSRFKPVLVDWVQGDQPGSTLVCVGAHIMSFKELP